MDDCYYWVIIVVLLLLINNNRESFIQRKSVCNSTDGRCYKVVSKFPSHVDASERLAYVNAFSIQLLRHMRNKYLWNTDNAYYKNITQNLLNRYNPENLMEHAPKGDVNTSYVKNKGDVFAVCLREKQTGKHNLIDKHMLEFVILHELSHLASNGFGHGHEFWINFKILLIEAQKIKLHQPRDYAVRPATYCSLYLNYNPYFDDKIPLP